MPGRALICSVESVWGVRLETKIKGEGKLVAASFSLRDVKSFVPGPVSLDLCLTVRYLQKASKLAFHLGFFFSSKRSFAETGGWRGGGGIQSVPARRGGGARMVDSGRKDA